MTTPTNVQQVRFRKLQRQVGFSYTCFRRDSNYLRGVSRARSYNISLAGVTQVGPSPNDMLPLPTRQLSSDPVEPTSHWIPL